MKEAILRSQRGVANAGGVHAGIVLKGIVAQAQLQIAGGAKLQQPLQLLQSSAGGDAIFYLQHATLRGIRGVGDRGTVGRGHQLVRRTSLLRAHGARDDQNHERQISALQLHAPPCSSFNFSAK